MSALDELARLERNAEDSAARLLTLRDQARAAGNDAQAVRYGAAYDKALDAGRAAAEKIEGELLNPSGEHVASLKQATDRLEARIEKMKQGIATMNDIAAIASIFTSAITIIGLL